MRPSRQALVTATLFVAYVALVALLVFHHEPWRDEADAWLMARDASVLEVVRIAGHSGTPGLWYFLQMPFAKAGLGFAWQAVLNLALVAGAAALLLRFSPLPLVIKALFLFGYYMSFEYSVVARNYGLGILLGFAALAWDPWRVRRPVPYGLLLSLLANVSAHFFFMASALGLVWLRDLWTAHVGPKQAADGASRRAAVLALAIVGVGALASLYQLAPRPGGQFPQDAAMIFVPRRLFGPSRAMFPEGVPIWLVPLAAAAWGAALLFLSSRRRALTFAAAGMVALTYIFVFKHVGGDRHYGLFLIVLVMALWMAENDRSAPLAWPAPSWPAEPLRERLRQATFSLVGACLAVQVLFSAIAIWPREIGEDYSEAERMGGHIRKHGLDRRTIVAHQANECEPVLPHLSSRSFYYPAISAPGSHMLWDARYSEGRRLGLNDAVKLASEKLPEFRDGNALLLSHRPLEGDEAKEFTLLYRTPGKPWRVPDEQYFLYERKR